MNSEFGGGKVIRPPMERIASGKEFRPHRRKIFKEWTALIVIFILLWVMGSLVFWGVSYLILIFDRGVTFAAWLEYIWFWWPLASLVYWVIMIPIYALIMIGLLLYINRIRYSVRTEKGDPMPEIFVRKGLINITEKHVPFRTITNIASRAGIFDRLFGIGNVEIHTAGFSGGAQAGAQPEERLEGLLFFEALRDFILQELRRFTGTYVTGTEVVVPAAMPQEMIASVDDEMLMTLRQIRDVLSRIDKKLDKE
ncbi:MAG: PH domain-containing protein [Candidatus Hodarchaeota archaeon]